MSSDWDMPETTRAGARVNTTSAVARASDMPAPRGSGVIDPVAFFRFVMRNIVRIGAGALAFAAIGILLISLVPFPYRATATVLVDPRNQQVTLQEGVLLPIGSDAAVLESMVQVMRSDGFLLTVMDRLGMLGDMTAKLSEGEQLKTLAKFKSNLSVERKGATYLVEISYKADTAEEAARIANRVADEFANTQNAQVRHATEDAARALSERLVELRRKLNVSEKAVADFAAENGILYVDDNNTLQMRQLTELSAQLALAKNATEAARARYDSQAGSGAGDVVLSDERNGEPAQLSYLRQLRAAEAAARPAEHDLWRAPSANRAGRQALEGIERQIRDERRNLTEQLKGELDVAEARQNKLEDDIAGLSSGAVLTDAAKVRLEALRREAAADRDIYEKFLARNKTTDELAAIASDNVKVVSPAVPPLKSSRPPLKLLAPVLGLLGAVIATTALAVAGAPGVAGMRRQRSLGPEAPPPGRTLPPQHVPANDSEFPVREPMRARRQGNALLSLAEDEPQPSTAEARAGDPQDPAAKSLLMMAETMRDAADEDDDIAHRTGGTRDFGR